MAKITATRHRRAHRKKEENKTGFKESESYARKLFTETKTENLTHYLAEIRAQSSESR